MRKIIWLILIAALVAAAGWLTWAVLTPAEPPAPTFVLLHPGYSTRRIAAELKAAGIIRSEEAFVLWHYVHRKRSLKAGEYLFDKPADIIDIQKRLRRGDVYVRAVVVPEGYTMFDIARAIDFPIPRLRLRIKTPGFCVTWIGLWRTDFDSSNGGSARTLHIPTRPVSVSSAI